VCFHNVDKNIGYSLFHFWVSYFHVSKLLPLPTPTRRTQKAISLGCGVAVHEHYVSVHRNVMTSCVTSHVSVGKQCNTFFKHDVIPPHSTNDIHASLCEDSGLRDIAVINGLVVVHT
jgi:hypothetical protein